MQQILPETTGSKVDRRRGERSAEQKRAAKQQRITDALARWNSLPDEAYVRVVTVAAVFGVSVPTIWRWCRPEVGILPRPHKLTAQTTAWTAGQVREARSAMLAKVPA
jgi:predicted DNA-binding transcriptional regulator AlpA